MKKKAIGLGAALLSAAGLGLGGLAHASADSNTFTTTVDPDNVGTLTLYSASGQPVTGGTLSDAPIAAYAVGSASLRAGDDRAALFAFTASDDVAGAWTGQQLSADASYPAAGAPAAAAGLPTVALDASGTSLASYVAAYPATGDNTNNYELRLRSSAPGKGLGTTYDALDITVDPTAGTWTVGTSNVVGTTTAIAVSPGTATTGATLTLTATVTPAAAAGSVQFKDGTKALGAPVAVVNGVATAKVTGVTGGAHSFTASFAPSDAGAYSASTSPAKSYTVAAKATTTTVSLSPAAPKAGTRVTINAAVTVGAAGKVQFYDGTAKIGSPVALVSGKAHATVVATTAGSHTFKGVFTPTSAASYKTSTGSKTVKVAKATPAVAVSLPTSVKHTAHATLTATVKVTNLTVTGKVTIYDGTRKLATVTLKKGKATYKLPLLKKGKHTIKVSYAASASVNAASVTKKITSK